MRSAVAPSASAETWSSASAMSARFMSFGDTQGMEPCQYASLSFDGVAPLMTATRYESFVRVQ